jgi:L-fuculose-phosphate aldolase
MLTNKITKQSFIKLCHILYEKQLVAGFGGNISAKLDNMIMTTPSGISLRDMAIKDIVFIDPDGRVTGSNGPPTREFLMHAGIFEVREEIQVVCHVHGKYLIAASIQSDPGENTIPALTPGFKLVGYPLAMLPFYPPGSAELATAVRSFFKDNPANALMLQNHGLIAIGTDMREALNIAEEINEAAAVFILSGGRYSTIPDK